MADFPGPGPCLPVISSYSQYSGAGRINMYGNGTGIGSSTVYPSANRGLFVPFQLPAPFLLAAYWCSNGATTSGNIDIGVYGVDGGLIASNGSTAQSATSTIQILTLGTPRVLNPGRYYMALSCSNTTATFGSRTPSVTLQQRFGVLQAASQLPLANAPTFATASGTTLPFFGIAQITTF